MIESFLIISSSKNFSCYSRRYMSKLVGRTTLIFMFFLWLYCCFRLYDLEGDSFPNNTHGRIHSYARLVNRPPQKVFKLLCTIFMSLPLSNLKFASFQVLGVKIEIHFCSSILYFSNFLFRNTFFQSADRIWTLIILYIDLQNYNFINEFVTIILYIFFVC